MKPVQLDDDLHREIQIIATLEKENIKNTIRNAVEVYKIKRRLQDRVIEFMRE